MEDVYVIVNDAFYENYLGGNLCKFPDFFLIDFGDDV